MGIVKCISFQDIFYESQTKAEELMHAEISLNNS